MSEINQAAQALADKRIERLNDLKNRAGVDVTSTNQKPTQMDYEDAEAVLNTIRGVER